MNKQELIDKLKRHLTVMSEVEGSEYDKGYKYATKQHLAMIAELYESEKPVVPKFVADWYEERKDYFDFNIYGFYKYFYSQGKHEEVKKWIDNAENKAIETLVKMKLYGYEVEKGKLYLASFRDTNQYLGWNEELGEWFMSCSPFTSGVEQTQETWEGVGIWNNPAFEIKKVEE